MIQIMTLELWKKSRREIAVQECKVKGFLCQKIGSNNKFIKVANEREENKEEVRKYFNDLYEETPGSPDYGDEMTEDYTEATPRFRIIKK